MRNSQQSLSRKEEEFHNLLLLNKERFRDFVEKNPESNKSTISSLLYFESEDIDNDEHTEKRLELLKDHMDEALVIAVQELNETAVKWLLKHGADANTKYTFDRTIITYLVLNRDPEISLRYLDRYNPITFIPQYVEGNLQPNNFLENSVSLRIAKALLDSGANSNSTIGIYSIFYASLRKNDPIMATLLLEYGATKSSNHRDLELSSILSGQILDHENFDIIKDLFNRYKKNPQPAASAYSPQYQQFDTLGERLEQNNNLSPDPIATRKLDHRSGLGI